MAKNEPPLEDDPFSMAMMATALDAAMKTAKTARTPSKVFAPHSVKVTPSHVKTAPPVTAVASTRHAIATERYEEVPELPISAYSDFLRPENRPAPQPGALSTNPLPPKKVAPHHVKESGMLKGKWRVPIILTIGVIVYLSWLLISSFAQNMYFQAADARISASAKAELDAAKTLLDKQKIENEIAKLKKEAKVTPATAVAVIAPAYDCTTAQSVENGFRDHVVHQLSDSSEQSVKLSGCAWYMVDEEVAGITGEGYNVQLPANKNAFTDNDSFYKSPTSENPDAGVFWNKIASNPSYRGQVVRIVLAPNGHVTITKKGS